MDETWRLVVLVSIGAWACLGGGPTGLQARARAETQRRRYRMLPAYPLPWERRTPGKADQFDVLRLSHPEWFSATVPPGRKFRALLEWEPTQALLLAYPGVIDKDITQSLAMMAVHAAPYAEVYVVSKDPAARQKFVQAMLKGGLTQDTIDEKVHFLDLEADSIWIVDYGPFPLLDEEGRIAFTDLRYYHTRVWDDAIPARLALHFGTTDYRGQLDYEGGNFATDGEGTCYTSQGVFWENPGMTADQVKQVFQDYLGCENLVVLKPLSGEGTTHIDMFSKLVSRRIFLLGQYTEQQDPKNRKVLDDDEEILKSVTLPSGAKLHVVRIPMPTNKDGVWRTYTNSTFVNPVNMVPVYSVDKDLEAQALEVWRSVLPIWKHIGILSDEVITWGGAMHCTSRNIPAGELAKWVEDGVCGTDGNCEPPEGGYSGPCKGDEDCYGPEHLCECNDCSTGCEPPKDMCEGISFEGCCTLDGVLKYCEDNQIKSQDCGGYDNCGWDPNNNWYDCDFLDEGPEGYPKACKGQDLCQGLPESGVCDGDVLKVCVDGQPIERDCTAEGLSCMEDPKKPGRFDCLCQDECGEGDTQCSEDGKKVLLCAQDKNGCSRMVEHPCTGGEVCVDGQCLAVSPEPPSEDATIGQDLGRTDAGDAVSGPAPDSAGLAGGGAGSGGGCSAGASAPYPTSLLVFGLLAAWDLGRRMKRRGSREGRR